jgi:hypothetical protein
MEEKKLKWEKPELVPLGRKVSGTTECVQGSGVEVP